MNEGLASLPMNILGLFKHPIFSSNYCNLFYIIYLLAFNSETDKLNALRIEFNYLGVDELMLNFVPYLFRIEDLSADTCYYTDEG